MPNRPNLILVLTDQQRPDSLGCYGSVCTRTPNLDRLAAEGVQFDRAYCCNPVCMPSRASIFSGKTVSRHGLWANGVNLPEDQTLISHQLARAGYRTHYIGKAHFQCGAAFEQTLEPHQRWEERYPAWTGPYYGFQSVELSIGHSKGGLLGHYGAWVKQRLGPASYEKVFCHADMRGSLFFGCNAFDWDLPTALHNSVWMADRGVDFIEKQAQDQPFFLVLGFQDPHHTHCVPRDLPERERVAFEATPAPDYEEDELADKPPHFAAARNGSFGGYPFDRVTPEEAREGRAYYYTLAQLIDREIGRVLAALERRGMADNTLIVFTSDHGELLGDHGLWMKGPYHYDCAVRVPLLMRWPAGFGGDRATTALFSHVDLVPTLLAAAGERPEDGLDGRNALPLLRGEAETVRDTALIEYTDGSGMRLKTLVTATHKLTWYLGQPYGELYDLERDPRERRNLWDDPAQARLKSQLLGCLLGELSALENRRAPMLVNGA